eukprot:scaffold132398_cov27-Prasinocladus_malaysianus.AAC.1
MRGGLIILLLFAIFVPACHGQHAFFQRRDLDETTGWRIDGDGAEGQVDCGADPFRPFDNGMSSFKQGTGQLRVFRNQLFVNQLFSQTVLPGFGFSKVSGRQAVTLRLLQDNCHVRGYCQPIAVGIKAHPSANPILF